MLYQMHVFRWRCWGRSAEAAWALELALIDEDDSLTNTSTVSIDSITPTIR